MVRAYFDDVGQAGLLLPDGWFGGRIMEGYLRLTFAASRPKRLIVELGDNLLLSFSGPVVVRRTTSTLVIKGGTPALELSGYSQFVLDFLTYGAERPELMHYRTGTVTFVGP